MLHLSQWPESVPIYGVEFPVIFADLGDDQGDMSYEPEPGGALRIRIHQRFRDTDWAWQVLFHEMTHAALAVSGTTALFKGQAEEAAVLAVEQGVWGGLQAISERVASRGSKGRATRTRSNPSRRRPGR